MPLGNELKNMLDIVRIWLQTLEIETDTVKYDCVQLFDSLYSYLLMTDNLTVLG